MPIDPSRFHKWNVIDTCSIWNLLSSMTLYSASRAAGCSYCCTAVVYYEAAIKPRSAPSRGELELQRLFETESARGVFPRYHLDVEDLQEVEVLERRKRLSKGELSSIAYAQKTRQAFLTDDQKARALAQYALPSDRTQTVPHLFSWLLFYGWLVDGDKDKVILEHTSNQQDLTPHLEDAYLLALEYRLKSRGMGAG